jgi:hypothetical protein
MQTIKLHSQVGEDGILHLDMPPELRGIPVDVTVTFEPVKQQDVSLPEEDLSQLEWRNFIEETAGSINDETFFRQPQGELPERESLA